jgi:uncharacterized protein YjiS (DUF1127 family)
MNARTADSQSSFHLPSLSYIDTRWEEPRPRSASSAPAMVRKDGIVAWLWRRFIAWHRDNQAAAALSAMTDYELKDIGLSRGDLPRVFQPEFNEDLRQSGLRV